MKNMTLQQITPIASKNNDQYRGIAFDGSHFYLTTEAKHITKFSRSFEECCCLDTLRPYNYITFDPHNKYFYATSFEPNKIYVLNRNCVEIDCLNISNCNKTAITSISYNCSNREIMIANQTQIFSINDCSDAQALPSSGKSLISSMTSISPYYTSMSQKDCSLQLDIMSHTCHPDLPISTYSITLPKGYLAKCIIFEPTLSTQCGNNIFYLLTTKNNCYTHILQLEICDKLEIAPCNYLECSPPSPTPSCPCCHAPSFCSPFQPSTPPASCDKTSSCACPCSLPQSPCLNPSHCQPSPNCQAPTHCPPFPQSCSALIESIALEQAALSHILNAEGEKLQKILACSSDYCEIINVNDSIQRTIVHVTNLEIVLYNKIAALQKICDDNPDLSCSNSCDSTSYGTPTPCNSPSCANPHTSNPCNNPSCDCDNINSCNGSSPSCDCDKPEPINCNNSYGDVSSAPTKHHTPDCTDNCDGDMTPVANDDTVGIYVNPQNTAPPAEDYKPLIKKIKLKILQPKEQK